MTTFAEYEQRIQGTKMPILGHICWYSLSMDVRVQHDELVKTLVRAGLNKYLPHTPSDADVFRKAATANSRKKQPSGNPDLIFNYLVRDANYDKANVFKRIVREAVAPKDHKLQYEAEVCLLTFDRETSMVSYKLGSPVDPVAKQIAETIVQTYEANRDTLDSYAVRETMRKALGDAHATSVRGGGGGVFFVSEKHADVIDSLHKLADAIPGVLFHSLPLIDDGKQREMVRAAFEFEMLGKVNDLIEEAYEMKKEGRSGDRYQAMLEQFNEASSAGKEYAELLQNDFYDLKSRMGVLRGLLMELSAI